MLLIIAFLIACTAVLFSYLARIRTDFRPFDQAGWVTSVSWNH
jgi:hypothetical protein